MVSCFISPLASMIVKLASIFHLLNSIVLFLVVGGRWLWVVVLFLLVPLEFCAIVSVDFGGCSI